MVDLSLALLLCFLPHILATSSSNTPQGDHKAGSPPSTAEIFSREMYVYGLSSRAPIKLSFLLFPCSLVMGKVLRFWK